MKLREGSLTALLPPTLEVSLYGGHEPGGEAVAVRGERHGLEDGRGQDGVTWRQSREVSNIDMHSVTVQICREDTYNIQATSPYCLLVLSHLRTQKDTQFKPFLLTIPLSKVSKC